MRLLFCKQDLGRVGGSGQEEVEEGEGTAWYDMAWHGMAWHDTVGKVMKDRSESTYNMHSEEE